MIQNELRILKHTADDEGLTIGSADLVANEIARFANSIGLNSPISESPLFQLGEIGGSKAKFLSGISKYAIDSSLRLEAELILSNNTGSKIFSVGGNHLRAVELIGYLRACHKLDLEPLVIWIDAHPDFHTDKTSETGNIHGMVASLLFGEGPDELTSLLGDTPRLKHENIIYIGLNQQDESEIQRLRERKITIFEMCDIEESPGNRCIIDEISKKVAGCDRRVGAWVEIDVDVLDSRDSPGAVMENESGMRVNQLKYLILKLAKTLPLVGMGVCEISPQKDPAGKTISITSGLAFAMYGIDSPRYKANLSERALLDGPQSSLRRVINTVAEVYNKFSFSDKVKTSVATIALGISAVFFNKVSKNEMILEKAKEPLPAYLALPENIKILNHDLQYAYTGVSRTSHFIPLPYKGSDLISEELLDGLITDYLHDRNSKNRDALMTYLSICDHQGLDRWEQLKESLRVLEGAGRLIFAQLKDDYTDFNRNVSQREIGDFARLWGAEKI